jgi:hypothetical protein
MDNTAGIAHAVSPQGRTVELTERKWAYVQRHVEMRGSWICCSRQSAGQTSKSQIRARDASATGFVCSRRFGFAG